MGETYRVRSAPLRPRFYERRSFQLAGVLFLAVLAIAVFPFWKFFLVVLGLAVAMAYFLREPREDGHPIAVTVDHEEIHFRHHPGAPYETVTSLWRPLVKAGYVVPTAGRARLALDGQLTQLVNVETDSVEDARALLHALGLSPLQRPLTFSFLNLRVTVGVDGVLVERPLTRHRRFVAHDEIFQVRKTHRKVILELENGTVYTIVTKGGDQHDALVERIIEATRGYGAAEHAEPLATLRQNGRTPIAWVKELRAMLEDAGGGYRAASLPEDTLWRVALDPSEPAEDRIGAGLALRAKLDDEGRAKLRIAAEAAASPLVRIALESAASDDDDAVVEALQRRL